MMNSTYELNYPCKKHSECSSRFPDSICWFKKCKCKTGFGPTPDRRSCKKSKQVGSKCSLPYDACYSSVLECNTTLNLCVCSAGYNFDRHRLDCYGTLIPEECAYNRLNGIWDPRCKGTFDILLPPSHQRPRLSVLTFFILIICCMIILRKTSSQNNFSNRRRTRSCGLCTDIFTLLFNSNEANRSRSNMPMANPGRRQLNSVPSFMYPNSSIRPPYEHEHSNEMYPDHGPPPAYEEIFRDRITESHEMQNVRPVKSDQDSNNNDSSDDTRSLSAETVRIDIPNNQECNVPGSAVSVISTTPNNLSSLASGENRTVAPNAASTIRVDHKPPSYDEAITMSNV